LVGQTAKAEVFDDLGLCDQHITHRMLLIDPR